MNQFPILFYISESLGGFHGAPQAARDILISLLATECPVTVISGNQCELPDLAGGKKLSSPKWMPSPLYLSFPVKLYRNYPRRVAAWLKHGLLDIPKRKNLRKLDPPELILVNSFLSHNIWRRLSSIIQGKAALIVHESPRHLDLQWMLKAMESYSSFIFVSSRIREEWLSLGNFSGKESFYIPNCCQEEAIIQLSSQDRSQVRQRLGLPSDRLVAVCVASVQHRKGQDLLLDYLPALMDLLPDLKVYLVGPITKEGKSILRRIQAGSFGDYLEVVGPRADALDFIYAADLLVLPSRAEAMPIVILEAMVLKTPVIASDVDGIPELINDGETGLLFSPDRPEGLVEAFALMANDPKQRKEFAERSHQRYSSNFSRAHHIRRYSEVIGKMVS